MSATRLSLRHGDVQRRQTLVLMILYFSRDCIQPRITKSKLAVQTTCSEPARTGIEHESGISDGSPGSVSSRLYLRNTTSSNNALVIGFCLISSEGEDVISCIVGVAVGQTSH